MTFYDDIGHLGSGIYKTLPKESILDSYEVRTINLYDFLIYHNVLHIDLLKIDCEGTEYDIIECIPTDYLKNVKKIQAARVIYFFVYNLSVLANNFQSICLVLSP